MLAYWRAGAAALRGPLVVGACIGCFVLGALTVPPTDPPRTTTTQPAAAITDQSVASLVAALDRFTQAMTVTTVTPPAAATATAAEADRALDVIAHGTTTTIAPATTGTTTTTTLPVTTTTEDETLRWPTTTVAP